MGNLEQQCRLQEELHRLNNTKRAEFETNGFGLKKTFETNFIVVPTKTCPWDQIKTPGSAVGAAARAANPQGAQTNKKATQAQFF
jgi:hypothetical protein